MTYDERKAICGRKLRLAQRLSDRAQHLWSTGDQMMAEAHKLAAEVDAILAGHDPQAKGPRPLPVRH